MNRWWWRCIVVGQRVRVGQFTGGQGPKDQRVEGAASVRGGRCAAVQTDRLLFERGALVRRKGGHDRLRQIAHPRPRRELESARRHTRPGISHIPSILLYSILYSLFELRL